MKGLGTNLRARLAKLEAVSTRHAEPIAILRSIVAAVNGKPVARQVRGWSFGQDEKRATVMRLEGESDLDLEVRATQVAFKAASGSNVVRLLSIVDKVNGDAA
jgi:hypothetical protein